jgi:hypothetical protein
VSMSFGDWHKQYLRVQVPPAVLFLSVWKPAHFLVMMSCHYHSP